MKLVFNKVARPGTAQDNLDDSRQQDLSREEPPQEIIKEPPQEPKQPKPETQDESNLGES